MVKKQPDPPEIKNGTPEWEKITKAAMAQVMSNKHNLDEDTRVFIYHEIIMTKLLERILNLEARLAELESQAELKQAWEEWQAEKK